MWSLLKFVKMPHLSVKHWSDYLGWLVGKYLHMFVMRKLTKCWWFPCLLQWLVMKSQLWTTNYGLAYTLMLSPISIVNQPSFGWSGSWMTHLQVGQPLSLLMHCKSIGGWVSKGREEEIHLVRCKQSCCVSCCNLSWLFMFGLHVLDGLMVFFLVLWYSFWVYGLLGGLIIIVFFTVFWSTC